VARLAQLAFLALLCLGSFGVGPSESTAVAGELQPIQIPLTVHIATQDGTTVMPQRRVLASVIRANEALREYGIQLTVERVELLPEGFTEIKGGRSRIRLAKLAQHDGTVHVFFVSHVALFSPRHGDRRVSGMHWRYHGVRKRIRQREYLVIARDAPSTTLVHEVGHAFGLNHHHAYDNLMCSCRRGNAPRFTRHQGLRMRGGARRFMSRAGND
jgi:hypothetical protein